MTPTAKLFAHGRAREDLQAAFAEIDRIMAGEDFLPELSAKDPPVKPDRRKFFGE